MENPYKTPESQLSRDTGVSFIAPLMVAVVVVINIWYITLYNFSSDGLSIVSAIDMHSHSLFMLCTLAQWFLIILNTFKMNKYVRCHPIINNQDDMDRLKPIIRSNMYSSLLMMPLFCISALTGIMSILPFDGLMSLSVLMVGVGTSVIFSWAKPSEEKLKNTTCINDELTTDLESLIHCWFKKALPDF